MRVAVVAEFYPRARDPVLGVWAHRQALAARDAGAEVSVFVLHRLVPPKRDISALAGLLRQPGHVTLEPDDAAGAHVGEPCRHPLGQA